MPIMLPVFYSFRALLLVFVLIASSASSASAQSLPVGSIYTPPSGSPERNQLMDAVRSAIGSPDSRFKVGWLSIYHGQLGSVAVATLDDVGAGLPVGTVFFQRQGSGWQAKYLTETDGSTDCGDYAFLLETIIRQSEEVGAPKSIFPSSFMRQYREAKSGRQDHCMGFRIWSKSAAASATPSKIDIPVVGCALDGQMGAQRPPAVPSHTTVYLPSAIAERLAYYTTSAKLGTGVLAPRGWSCFGTVGSSGSQLFVSPRPLAGPILDRPAVAAKDVGIIKSHWNGDTSGRFAVATIAARLFPKSYEYVDDVEKGSSSQERFVRGPWPDDEVALREALSATVVTPSNRKGVGTDLGFVATSLPIFSSIMAKDIDSTRGAEPHLDAVAVRLPPDASDLRATIIGVHSDRIQIAPALAMTSVDAGGFRTPSGNIHCMFSIEEGKSRTGGFSLRH